MASSLLPNAFAGRGGHKGAVSRPSRGECKGPCLKMAHKSQTSETSRTRILLWSKEALLLQAVICLSMSHHPCLEAQLWNTVLYMYCYMLELQLLSSSDVVLAHPRDR